MTIRAYASRTSVSPQKTRQEIESVITRYNATGFGYIQQNDKSMIVFEMNNRRVRFALTIPLPKSDKPKHMYEAGQVARQRWRALLLCIKAKLEAVTSNILLFDEEFLAYIVMPDGKTVAERLIPEMHNMLTENKLPPLLPGPANA